MKDVIRDNLYTIVETMTVFFLGIGLGAALMDAIKDWISEKERRYLEMRRCYFCGAKKMDDSILCKECEQKLNEKLGRKEKEVVSHANKLGVKIQDMEKGE